MAVPKSEFTYFHYGNESYLDGLEAFCAPYEVKKTLSDIKDEEKMILFKNIFPSKKQYTNQEKQIFH